jgi:hypothetical protein
MLLTELRELLRKYPREELALIITEMYKTMPKKLREDKNIDRMIENYRSYINTAKVKKQQIAQINIEEIKRDIEMFIDYSYKQYYYAPNNFIHKKERPKWRFKVKRYINDLQCFAAKGDDGDTATNLLKRLYELLCYACSYYLFNSEDPFNSVGIVQEELLIIVISRIFYHGINEKSVRSAIELIINNGTDRNTLYSDLFIALIDKLKIADSKEIAIAQCKILIEELQSTNSIKKNNLSGIGNSVYTQKEKIINMVEAVFRFQIALYKYEEAIQYYKINNGERNKEISLYVLLRLLFEYRLKDYWLREYEIALKEGVIPRDGLKRMYKYIKSNGELPNYIY